VLVLTVTGGRVVFDGDAPLETAAASTRSSAAPAATTTEAPRREATLVFGGDILVHSGVWDAAATVAGYDFSSMLAPIAPRLSEADVAICHLEVTLARPGEALSGYPRFRAPTELATDLAEAGFDGCSVASNHALDFGEPGVVATLDAMDAAGLPTPAPPARRRPANRRSTPRTASPSLTCPTRTASTASSGRRAGSGSSTRSTRP
jgi:hypothetical protein